MERGGCLPRLSFRLRLDFAIPPLPDPLSSGFFFQGVLGAFSKWGGASGALAHDQAKAYVFAETTWREPPFDAFKQQFRSAQADITTINANGS